MNQHYTIEEASINPAECSVILCLSDLEANALAGLISKTTVADTVTKNIPLEHVVPLYNILQMIKESEVE